MFRFFADPVKINNPLSNNRGVKVLHNQSLTFLAVKTGGIFSEELDAFDDHPFYKKFMYRIT